MTISKSVGRRLPKKSRNPIDNMIFISYSVWFLFLLHSVLREGSFVRQLFEQIMRTATLV
jgi:hypothetical protein